MTENHKLKIRAAVVWEELTPRPDLTPIMKMLGLEPSIYQDKGSKQIAHELIEHINSRIVRSKTRKEKNDTYLEVPLISSKTYVNTKSNSSNSRKNSLDIIIENEENKNDNISLNKKNISMLSPIIDLEIQKIQRENSSEKLSKCLVEKKVPNEFGEER